MEPSSFHSDRSSRLQQRALLLGLLSLAACGDTAGSEPRTALRDGDTCAESAFAPEVRTDLLATMFPESATDSPLFCRLEPDSGSCLAEASHLDDVLAYDGPTPSVTACRDTSSGNQILSCDRYAKHLIKQALDDGDLIGLLRGATRLRDVMKRPQVPAYYTLQSPQNIFAQRMQSMGVDMAALGGCVEGSDDDGYACLATGGSAPDDATVRGLLRFLDHHNGVLGRAGNYDGLSDREANIFRSSMAPVATHFVHENEYSSEVARKHAAPELLAKVFGLRLVDGTAGEGAMGEDQAFLEMLGYQPVGAATPVTATFGLFAAQAAAFSWDEDADAAGIVDHRLVEGLRAFSAAIRTLGTTSVGLGRCDLTSGYESIWTRTAGASLVGPTMRARFFPDFDHLPDFVVPRQSLLGLFGFGYYGYVEECQLHNELVAVTVPENRVLEVSAYTMGAQGCVDEFEDEFGQTADVVSCECIRVDPYWGCDRWEIEIEYEDYERWIDYGESLEAHEVHGGTLATTIVKEKVDAAYNALISSADGAYDHTGDGHWDLHHTKGESVPVSILESGVGWHECQAELVDRSGTYAAEQLDALGCDPGSSVPGISVDGDCVSSTLSTHEFIPYAIAARVCPEYTAQAVGVLDSDFRLDECTTPWAFTQAVEYFLRRDIVPDEVIQDYPEYGPMTRPLVIDFAAEALHLSQPVAAMYKHRADFASVAGTIPEAYAGSGETWYATYSGLDVVDGMLEIGESVMAAGLDLFNDFTTLEVWGSPASSIMPYLHAGAFDACDGGSGCAINDETHRRALLYRRVRDSVETYDRLASERLDVQWRRLDGAICYDHNGANGYDTCESCLQADPATGALQCDETRDLTGDGSGDCEDECVRFDAATNLTEGGAVRLSKLGDAMAEQGSHVLLEPDQADYLAAVEGFARAVGSKLDRQYGAMLAGVDWLGYRSGLWFPAPVIDPVAGIHDVSDAINAEIADLASTSAQIDFDQFISDYLGRVTSLQDWATEINDTATVGQSQVAALCSGGADACETAWNASHDLVAAINEVVETRICGRNVEFAYDNAGVPTLEEFPVGPTAVDCSAQLLSPDFSALDGLTGTIPEKAAAMEVTLTDALVAVEDVAAYLDLIEHNEEVRYAMGEVLDARVDVEQRAQNILDGITCGVAVLGGVAQELASATCDVSTAGACTALTATTRTAVWTGVGTTCANAFNDESVWFPNAPTRAEIERAYHEYQAGLAIGSEAYTATTKIQALLGHYARYNLDVVGYLGLFAELDRVVAYDDAVLGNVVNSTLFDPSHQLFEEESLASMKSSFNEVAKRVRNVQRLVEYGIGQGVVEGGDLDVGLGSRFHLPRLSEITIFRQTQLPFGVAYEHLETAGGMEGLMDVRGANLISYASLLAHLHDTFVDVYDGRQESEPAYIGGTGPGLWGVDYDLDGDIDEGDALLGTNPGEYAFLGDSPFYDPRGYVDLDKEGEVPCALGLIDLSDYCDVPAGTCFDVAELSVLERYSLAYLDHMTVAPGHSKFECGVVEGECELDESGLCVDPPESAMSIWVADRGIDGVFSFADLGGIDTGLYLTNDADYVGAQTRVVQAIISRYETDRMQRGVLDASQLKILPGSYLFMVNMAPEAQAVGFSSTSFDPELEIMTGEADDTIAEHLLGIALLCTDRVSCADQSRTYDADAVLLAGGYLGSRCKQRDTYRQERVAFDMDPALVEIGAEAVSAADDVDSVASSVLADPTLRDRFRAEPVHTNSWVVSLVGHSDRSGTTYTDGGHPAVWALYHHLPNTSLEEPRIRFALQYSYIHGAPQSGDFEYDVRGLLECPGGSDATSFVGGTP